MEFKHKKKAKFKIDSSEPPKDPPNPLEPQQVQGESPNSEKVLPENINDTFEKVADVFENEPKVVKEEKPTIPPKKDKNKPFYETEADAIAKSYKTEIDEDPSKYSFGKIVEWGAIDVNDIADKLYLIMERLCDVQLFPYQKMFALQIFRTILLTSGDELTALFSRQAGKCLAKGTEVLIWGGGVKKVEDLKKGDQLIGPDGTPRKILSVTRGREEMYEVKSREKNHESFTVNKSHILSVTNRKNEKKLFTVEEYLKEPSWKRIDDYRGWRVPVEYSEIKIPVEPYWFGLWIGDGGSYDVRITNTDAEIISYLKQYSKRLGMELKEYKTKNRCIDYAITNGREKYAGKVRSKNVLLEYLKSNKLIGNKKIPDAILYNSRKVRLEFLAGLIDSDGHRSTRSGKENVCEIVTVSETLCRQYIRLFRSLGFRASAKRRTTNMNTDAFRVMAYGDFSVVPTLIPRKQWPKVKLRENPLTFGFDLISKGEGEYFGFEIDGDKLFVLGDYTVTHNTEVVADVGATAMVMMPVLANYFPQLEHYKNGIHIGIFAPTLPQAQTLGNRLDFRLSNEKAVEFLRDPEINQTYSDRWLSSGSFARVASAAPQTKIESKTYHLAFLDEAQDILEDKILRGIHPMLAAVSGSVIKTGTPIPVQCEFFDAILRNKRQIAETKGKVRNHFEFDYKVVCQYNQRYRKFIDKEIARHGEHSDYFRMSYKLEWLLDKGMAITVDQFNEKMKYPAGKLEIRGDTKTIYAAGLDLGKKYDSTVLTIFKTYKDANKLFQDDHEESDYYNKQVVNWYEFDGDNWESQIEQIIHIVKDFPAMQGLAVDSTGVGDPIAEILTRKLSRFDLDVIPVYFTLKMKHQLAQLFYKNLNHGNIKIPAHQSAKKTKKFDKFYHQLTSAEKIWKSSMMQLTHPNVKGAKDDYVQSFLIGLYACEHIINQGGVSFSEGSFFHPQDMDKDEALDTGIYDMSEVKGFENVRSLARNGRLVQKAKFMVEEIINQ